MTARRTWWLAAAIAAALPAAVAAQGHDMHDMPGMPGMTMPPTAKPRPPAPRAKPLARNAPAKPRPTPARRPAPSARKPAAPTPTPATAPSAPGGCTAEHAAMGHCAPMAAPAVPVPTGDAGCSAEHAAMGHCRPAADPPSAAPAGAAVSGTDLPAGDGTAPPAPRFLAAARVYGAATMAAADRQMRCEHGGGRFSQLLANLAELRGGRGGGYRWDGQGWFGGDIDRLVVKTQGEGDFGGGLDAAEVQALASHAIGPYFDVQAGVRQDLGPGGRSYATIGIEGLAPYWFDVEAALFLSTHGDLLARLEGYHDARITQRLILQPRAELSLAAQDVAASRIGAGVSAIEAGLRLRYEIRREFAPYLGVSWERLYGATARLARAAGDGRGGVRAVAGVRAWF